MRAGLPCLLNDIKVTNGKSSDGVPPSLTLCNEMNWDLENLDCWEYIFFESVPHISMDGRGSTLNLDSMKEELHAAQEAARLAAEGGNAHAGEYQNEAAHERVSLLSIWRDLKVLDKVVLWSRSYILASGHPFRLSRL